MLSNRYFIIALLEGCTVLAVEILGGKMITAIFGSSLFVWTSVIGITLTALTIGYFIGGRISAGSNAENMLFHFLLLCSLLIVLMPILAHPVIRFCTGMGVLRGALFSTILLISPPLICLGTITPIVIHLASKKIESAGKISGFVYALTTIGGIVTTFLLGFFIVPQWGITYPLLTFSIIIGYYTAYLFYSKARMLVLSLFVVIFLMETVFLITKKNIKYHGAFTKLYEKEGLLGQLKVADYNQQSEAPNRRLFINGISQTFVDKTTYRNSLWDYPHIISSIATMAPYRNHAAVFGVGGGSVAKELTELGFQVDAIDIDKRMFELATRFFFLSRSKVKFTIDDARHYFRTCKKKYDVVVIDLLNGEVQPSYVFSIESFLEVRKMLTTDGIIIIEFQSNPKGIASHSIFKTLSRAGFFVYYTQNGDVQSDAADVIFTASLIPLDLKYIDKSKVNPCCAQKIIHFYNHPVYNHLVDTAHALVLTDDRPMLDHLNKSSIINYRKTQVSKGTLIYEEIHSGRSVFQ